MIYQRILGKILNKCTKASTIQYNFFIVKCTLFDSWPSFAYEYDASYSLATLADSKASVEGGINGQVNVQMVWIETGDHGQFDSLLRLLVI